MQKTIKEILECEFKDEQEKLCWYLVFKTQKVMLDRIRSIVDLTEEQNQLLCKDIK